MLTQPAVVLAFVLGPFLLLSAPGLSESAAPNSSPTGNARVFITESESWETSGGSGGGAGAFAGEGEGGARPQTAEIIKTFNQRCPDVTTNNIPSKADYVVVLEHEGGKGYLRHANKLAVFTRVTGDSLVSKSTLTLGGAVQEACQAIRKDWEKNSSAIRASESAGQHEPSPAGLDPAPESAVTKLSVTSTPVGADIDLDGDFVGNTPSVLDVSAGKHTVRVTKAGYRNWERSIKAQGGSVNLTVELDAQAN